jgi:hypothetical protein
VSAKAASPDGELHLSGTFDGKPWQASFKLSGAVEGTGIGKLWARNKIASLEGKLYVDGNSEEIAKEIEAVALKHHLVSSETSLVAIDTAQSRPDGQGLTSTDMPVNLPDGWHYDKVFGAPAPGQQAAATYGSGGSYNYMAKASRSGSLRSFDSGAPAALPAPSPVPSYAPSVMPYDGGDPADAVAVAGPEMDETGGPAAAPDPSMTAFDNGEANTLTPETAVPALNSDVTAFDKNGPDAQLPETTSPASETAQPQLAVPPVATPDDLIRQVVMFALLLAILSAVTLLSWRYHRRDYASPRRTRRRI